MELNTNLGTKIYFNMLQKVIKGKVELPLKFDVQSIVWKLAIVTLVGRPSLLWLVCISKFKPRTDWLPLKTNHRRFEVNFILIKRRCEVRWNDSCSKITQLSQLSLNRITVANFCAESLQVRHLRQPLLIIDRSSSKHL